MSLRKMGDLEQAAVDLKKGIQAVPESPVLYAESAVVAFLSGDVAGSERMHLKFLEGMNGMMDGAGDINLVGHGYLREGMIRGASGPVLNTRDGFLAKDGRGWV